MKQTKSNNLYVLRLNRARERILKDLYIGGVRR